MAIDPGKIAQSLEDAAAATDADTQGKLYEALIEYIFSAIPGCIAERNISNPFRTEQVDIAVGHAGTYGTMGILPGTFLVECKDWNHPVSSKEVGYFFNILDGRSLQLGILIAASGITGNPTDLSHAHALGLTAAPRGINLIVLTDKDLREITSVDDLVDKVCRLYLRAIASGGIGVTLT
jgi:hypothetical protein